MPAGHRCDVACVTIVFADGWSQTGEIHTNFVAKDEITEDCWSPSPTIHVGQWLLVGALCCHLKVVG